MTSIESTVERINKMASKSQEMPKCFSFSVENTEGDKRKATIHVDKSGVKSGLRSVDPWMMVFLSTLQKFHLDLPITDVSVEFCHKPPTVDLESFCRRWSYLAINNGWNASIVVAGESESNKSYRTISELLDRPDDEVWRDGFNERNDNLDSNGKIEKNLQTWLAGNSRDDNERLAVLGEDFIFGKGPKPKVIREFPTGAFRGSKSRLNRLLKTYWVDLVTLNRSRQLAIIELKVNDGKLDVMAQALDYALFFSCYRKLLAANLTKSLGRPVDGSTKIACYVASNCFHQKFPEVSKFYSPKSDQWPFILKRCTLGAMPFGNSL